MALLEFNSSPIDSAIANLLQGPYALGRAIADEWPSPSDADAFQAKLCDLCGTLAALARLARESDRQLILVSEAAKAITMACIARCVVKRLP